MFLYARSRWRRGWLQVVVLLCLWWLACGPDVKAQTKNISNYEIRRISMQDGLANQVITAVCTDTTGTLWIGTLYGVYTFDGFRVTNFDNALPPDPPWPKPAVSNLTSDTVGRNLIFASTRGGVWAIDPAERRLVPDTTLGLPAGFLKTCVYIEKSTGGFYWLLGKQTLYKLFRTAANRYECQPVLQLPACEQPALQTDPTDSEGVWILPAQAEVYYWNTQGLAHYTLPKNRSGPSPAPGLTRWLYTGKSIVGWDHARNLYCFNTREKRVELVGDTTNFYSFFPGMEGVDNGIKQKPRLNLHLPIEAGQQLFGTTLGLFIVRKKLSCFQIIEALQGEEVRGIHTSPDGQWWAGTYNGLYSGNLNNRKVQHFDAATVWDFLPLRNGRYLLALEHRKGIVFWDAGHNRFIPDSRLLAQVEGAPNATSALSLCQDNEGTFWAGTYTRLLWARESYDFRSFTDIRSGRELDIPFVRALLADTRSGIWAGSENGLLRLVYNAKQQRYEADQSIPTLEGITVCDLYRDCRQQLWIATKGKGIACLDMKNPRQPLQWYTTADGLSNDFTCRIEGSNHDRVLWISTHNGLSKFDVQTRGFHNFYEDSGFPGNEFNSAASARFPDGTLLFGGISGLIRFHPDAVPSFDFQYKTILSGAKFYDQSSGLFSSIPPASSSNKPLPPYPEYIEFQLGSTEYTEPAKVRFRYRLHGLSERWSYTNGEREVKFIRLAPGKYIFEAQVIPLDGHLGTTVLFPFFIATPFYETWWFKALLLTAIAGVAYGAYRYRLRQLIQEQKTRQQIADDLHDDIGNKLNMISILSQKVARHHSRKEQPDLISGELDKLVDVGRTALRSLHTMIWSVDSEKDRLSILFSRMQDFADDYLLPLHIPYRFEMKEPIPDRDIDLTVRYHLILIYQELLTNMVKYTQPSLITITISMEAGHTLHLEFANQHQPDSDVAFNTVSSHRGLASIQRRLSRINGKIIEQDISGTRQKIALVIPRISKRF